MCRTIGHRYLLLTVLILLMGRSLASAVNCEVCGWLIEVTYYTRDDKVANIKRKICYKCNELTDICFLCTMPVVKDFKKLPDGRSYCERDVKSVVFDDAEAIQICHSVRESIERLFSRFTTFPGDNVTILLVDRINLITLLNRPGRDLPCPNIMGYMLSYTNQSSMQHEVALMSGLDRGTLKSTFAHECAHAWMAENVPPHRRRALKRDSEEGFCELVAYMLATSQNDEESKHTIEQNGYTRGQFAIFREAERQFGFNDIMEWMKYGVDRNLREDDIARVRIVEIPKTTVAHQSAGLEEPPPVYRAVNKPTTFTLNGIIWSQRPTALINNRNFMVNDQAQIKLASDTVLIRCLSIRTNSVQIQKVETGEKIELKLE